jgi:hypothetical protein
LCADHDVRHEKLDEHFIGPLPTSPLVLRGTSTRNEYTYEKERGRLLSFDPTAETEMLEAEVKELNEFFGRFELRRGTHRGFIRVFNNGDDPEFRWNKGGRLYSHGKVNYQTMKRRERLRMTIDEEAVCEIDIRASYLTIFHAWHNQQLDPARDPYDLPAFGKDDRDVVKMWFVVAFGSDGEPRRWPRKFIADYREDTNGRSLGKDYPIKSITKVALETYPLLRELGKRKNAWADLMWHESMAMIDTMLELKRKHSIPSLSVHDSLIVPISAGTLAATVLKNRYYRIARVEPKLVLHTAEGDEEVEDIGMVPLWIEFERLDREEKEKRRRQEQTERSLDGDRGEAESGGVGEEDGFEAQDEEGFYSHNHLQDDDGDDAQSGNWNDPYRSSSIEWLKRDVLPPGRGHYGDDEED